MFGIAPIVLMIIAFVAFVTVVLVLGLGTSNFRRGANPNLINCPDCSRLVSRNAAACPQCGMPMPGK